MGAPIIAISGDLKTGEVEVARLKLAYIEAVRGAGGVPLILPSLRRDELEAVLDHVDGVILSGGDDVDPRERGVALHAQAFLMDSRRQSAEVALARCLLERDLPTLGICLGMQVLCYAAGADLHQHLPDADIPELLDHRAPHAVQLTPGSRLAGLLGTELPHVVSHHHQAVESAPHVFRPVGRAADGVIEAIESNDARFLFGVQWHPERSPETQDSRALFRALVAAAAGRHT